jgi:predicted nucleotide-binding protein
VDFDNTDLGRARKVFVVHGRNAAARSALFSFLRSIDLRPIEWAEAIALTGDASPVIGQILDAALNEAQAIVVLFTPDDVAYLRQEYRNGAQDPDAAPQGQARPNVLFEAGMAMGRNPRRTVLVELGQLRSFSDIAGRYVLRLDNLPESRLALARRLEAAGCAVNLSGHDWISTGDFSAPSPPDRLLAPARSTRQTAAVHGGSQPVGAVPAQVRQASASATDTAENIVGDIADPRERAGALADIAAARLATDRPGARRLLDEAERIARSVADPGQQALAMGDVAKAMARLNIADAESIARDIGVVTIQLEALEGIANVVADRDQAEAMRRLAEAEARARKLDRVDQAKALQDAAIAIGRLDPKEAARIAGTIATGLFTDYRSDDWAARYAIASSLASRSPETALGIVRSIPNSARAIIPYALLNIAAEVNPENSLGGSLLAEAEASALGLSQPGRDDALLRTAELMARRDSKEAQRIAYSIAEPRRQALALASIAVEMAASDWARAEQLADTIFDRRARAGALASIARMISGSDADNARRLLAEAERISRTIAEPRLRAETLNDIGSVLVVLDQDAAWRLFDDAERTALDLATTAERDTALEKIAVSISTMDLAEGERIARSIVSPQAQVRALLAIVGATNSADAARLLSNIDQIANAISPQEERDKSLRAIIAANLSQESGSGAA